LYERFRNGSLGFSLTEVMRGEHQFEPGFGETGWRPMSFRVQWGPQRLRDWLNPRSDAFLTQPLRGTVSIAGLCEDATCEGTLELRYFNEHRIRYAFSFEVAGESYRLVAEKVNIQPWNLPVSHTTCFGTLVESRSGRLVSRSVTYFRLSALLSFLLGFRLSLNALQEHQ